MNMSEKYVLKQLFLQSTAYVFAGIRWNFYFMPGP